MRGEVRVTLPHLPRVEPDRISPERTTSPRFRILRPPSPGLHEFSANLLGTQRRRKNAKALTVRELGPSVMLIAHLENTEETTLKLLTGLVRGYPQLLRKPDQCDC